MAELLVGVNPTLTLVAKSLYAELESCEVGAASLGDGVPFSRAVMRSKLMAAAVMTCCRGGWEVRDSECGVARCAG